MGEQGRYAVQAPDGRRVYSDDPAQAQELAGANRRAGCAAEVIDTEKVKRFESLRGS